MAAVAKRARRFVLPSVTSPKLVNLILALLRLFDMTLKWFTYTAHDCSAPEAPEVPEAFICCS